MAAQNPQPSSGEPTQPLKISVLIPCLNEERTIGKVVRNFRAELPEAEIIVCDNASTDNTAAEARAAGARVMTEKRRGKGHVIKSMFRNIEADLYIMVDGDDTYPADKVRLILEPVLSGEADMVVGSRITNQSQSEFRLLNLLGNKFYQYAINLIFNARLTDILSGFRCMNRDFVKGLPLFGGGFEIETELTIKALERSFRIVEIPITLRARPEGSHSKIKIVKDGFRILRMILSLFRDYKPLTFFGVLGGGFMLAGLIPGLVVIFEYLRINYIHHVPSAILASGLEVTGLLFLLVGVILHTMKRRFQELEYLTCMLLRKR